jgi:hypothetical protein
VRAFGSNINEIYNLCSGYRGLGKDTCQVCLFFKVLKLLFIGSNLYSLYRVTGKYPTDEIGNHAEQLN